MRKHFYLLSFILILFACSKEDNTTPEPEPVEVPKYTVTIKAGDGGTVSTAGGTYSKDIEVSVSATPNTEYIFDSWSDGNTENPRTIKVGADLTITANFVKKQYDLSVTVVGEGTVAEEVVIQGGRYNSGSQIKLTATAEEGWEYNSWSGDLESTENPITLTINTSLEITATFTAKDSDEDGIPDINDDCPNSSNVYVDDNGCPLPSIYLHSNGVTVMAEEWAEVGETYLLNGDSYLVVDENMLRTMVENNEFIENVVTSRVTNMTALFKAKHSFNQDISSWDVSKVTSMHTMFSAVNTANGMSFNQNISYWDVSEVKDFSSMFWGCTTFNQNINNWNVSNGENFRLMFAYTRDFNSPLNNWDLTSATSIESMFIGSKSFNQSLNNWQFSKVTSLGEMFSYTESFNQNLNSWDVSNINNFISMFSFSKSFNGDISDWDTSSATSMAWMFRQAKSFNQDVSRWNVSKVESFYMTFQGALMFNIDISNWDTSNVISMQSMFASDLSTDLAGGMMFNQDLSKWNVDSVINCQNFSFVSSFFKGEPIWTLPKPNFTKCTE